MLRRIGPAWKAGLSAAATAAALFLCFPAAVQTAEKLPSGGLLDSAFGIYLTDRLTADGFDRAKVEKLLLDSRSEVLKTTLAYAIVYKETKADYSGFLSPQRLSRAKAFLKRKKTILEASEKKYQVPPEVTAAILMIESDFGSFRKLHRIFNVFTTLIWSSRPENFEKVQEVIRARLPDTPLEKIKQRSRKKALWGYQQLTFLLRIAEREKIDPLSLEGSWAGAFGLPQFIPSSYWDYAVDGNADSKVELFDEDDAIFSIGNYLRSFGWKNSLDDDMKKAVLRKYNNSGLYVDTVLAAASRLESASP